MSDCPYTSVVNKWSTLRLKYTNLPRTATNTFTGMLNPNKCNKLSFLNNNNNNNNKPLHLSQKGKGLAEGEQSYTVFLC